MYSLCYLNQLANVLTKGLMSSTFHLILDKLGRKNSLAQALGGKGVLTAFENQGRIDPQQ